MKHIAPKVIGVFFILYSLVNCTKEITDDYILQPDPVFSSENKILQFSFLSDVNSTLNINKESRIDTLNKKILFRFSQSTDITNLIPSVTISDLATLNPKNGTALDFTSPVIYNVIAENGDISNYIVSIERLTERETLLAFYNANPGNDLTWDFTADDISDWEGVSTDTEGHVIGLRYLFNRGLTMIPREIENLMYLKTLEIANNNMIRIPSEIGHLTKLEKLKIINAKLTEIPESIGNLLHLKELVFNNNAIGQLPSGIENLINISLLLMSGNNLTSIAPEISTLSKLQNLNLTSNALTSLPEELGRLKTLDTLFLLGNSALIHIPTAICDLETIGTTIIKEDIVICN